MKFDKKDTNLLLELSKRNFQIKDQYSFLGILWSLCHPLLMTLVLYFLFRGRLGKTTEYYPLFLLSGIICFNFFTLTTQQSMRKLFSSSSLILNTYIKKELLVFSCLGVSLISFSIELVGFLFLKLILGSHFGPSIIFLPFAMVNLIFFTLAVSVILSILYIYIRDIEHIWSVFLRILFFCSAIFYPAHVLSGVARELAVYNPLFVSISFMRFCLLNQPYDHYDHFLYCTVINFLFLLFSILFFKTFESRAADKL